MITTWEVQAPVRICGIDTNMFPLHDQLAELAIMRAYMCTHVVQLW
jgi:hypothetical protein